MNKLVKVVDKVAGFAPEVMKAILRGE